MKRVFDLILLIILTPLLLLPLIVIAALVYLTSKGSVLHWSSRIGKDNKIFQMPKFRSMQNDTPTLASNLLKDPANYITSIGSFLRRNSLDELPQIWSIWVGDMSFVGPRPVLDIEHELIKLRTKYKIHKLTPGLTGWAQVNGRDYLDNHTKVRLDFIYLKRKSLLMDIYILWLTFIKVISQAGVAH